MATREEYQAAMMAAHRAGDTAGAQKLAQAIAAMPATQQPPLGIMGGLKGAADVGLAGLRGTAHQLVGSGMGLGGAIHQAGNAIGIPGARPGMSYMAGRDAYMQAAGDDQLPIKGGQLRTPEGERVAAWLGGLPGVQQVGQAIENVGQGIENVAGPEARDLATSAVTLGTMKAGPVRPTGAAAEAVGRAQRAGYVVPPTTVLGADVPLTERAASAVSGRPAIGEAQYAGSTADRAARNFGGGSDVDARISMRNQQVTQQLAMEAARLPEMTPDAVRRAATQASGVYDTIKGLTGPNNSQLYVPLNSQNYFNRVMALAKTPGWDSAAPMADSVANLRNDLLSVRPTVEGVVNRVRQLREDAFKNFDGDAEAQMLGRAQREAADILDDELSSQLQFISQNASNPNLRAITTRIFDEYTEARRQLSVLHNTRYAMNPSTGTIDAAKFAKLRSLGQRLEPGQEEIASAHAAFGGNGMQTAEKAGKTAGSPLGTGDILSGAFVGSTAGGMTGSATNAIVGGAIGALAIPFSRYAAREFALRDPGTRAAMSAGQGVLKAGARGTAAGAQIEERK